MPRKKIPKTEGMPWNEAIQQLYPSSDTRWSLTQADIESITDEEHAKGTTRFMPKPEEIPDVYYGPFKGYGKGNIYFRLAELMYTGDNPEPGDIDTITFNDGFTGEGFERFLQAHLKPYEAEYQHRMAGIAYMIATVVTIKEP